VWKNWPWAYKTGDISETVLDGAKVTINGQQGWKMQAKTSNVTTGFSLYNLQDHISEVYFG